MAYQHHQPQYPQPHVIIARSNDRRLKLVIFSLLLLLGYVVFCVVGMAPEARAHFLQIFMNPGLSFLLAQ